MADHGAIESMSRYILKLSLDFLARQKGQVRIQDVDIAPPLLYWIAVVKHFCHIQERYMNPKRSRLFYRHRLNYALRHVPYKDFGLGQRKECSKSAYMRKGNCTPWLYAGQEPELKD